MSPLAYVDHGFRDAVHGVVPPKGGGRWRCARFYHLMVGGREFVYYQVFFYSGPSKLGI